MNPPLDLLAAEDAVEIRFYNFESDDESHINGADLSDLSDAYVSDTDVDRDEANKSVSAHLALPGKSTIDDNEVEPGLSLDDIPYDRDLKWINVPNGARPKPSIASNNRLFQQVQSITGGNSKELKHLDDHYGRMDQRKIDYEEQSGGRDGFEPREKRTLFEVESGERFRGGVARDQRGRGSGRSSGGRGGRSGRAAIDSPSSHSKRAGTAEKPPRKQSDAAGSASARLKAVPARLAGNSGAAETFEGDTDEADEADLSFNNNQQKLNNSSRLVTDSQYPRSGTIETASRRHQAAAKMPSGHTGRRDGRGDMSRVRSSPADRQQQQEQRQQQQQQQQQKLYQGHQHHGDKRSERRLKRGDFSYVEDPSDSYYGYMDSDQYYHDGVVIDSFGFNSYDAPMFESSFNDYSASPTTALERGSTHFTSAGTGSKPQLNPKAAEFKPMGFSNSAT